MPSFELTDNLRQTIRDLRKKKRKRGDELSKELGKGASYISQVENGKIKEIDFDLLDDIFRKITDLPEPQYNEFLNNLLDNVSSHLTKEELQHEKWMHQFNHEIRQYPITDSLVEFIKNELEKLHYTPSEFVKIINQNRGLEGVDLPEPNKLQIEIVDSGNGGYGVYSSIRFDLPDDFISKILSKETKTISYIYMQGILFNIFLSEDNSFEDAHKKTDDLLYENKFYTIKQRNKIIHDNLKEKTEKKEKFTFYDIQPTDYDKQYTKLESEITDGLEYLRDKNIVYTCERLEEFVKNMHDDLGLSIAIMSSPVYRIDENLKQKFWDDYRQLVKSYINQSKNTTK